MSLIGRHPSRKRSVISKALFGFSILPKKGQKVSALVG